MKSIRGDSELKLTVVSAIHPCQYYQATFPSLDGEIVGEISSMQKAMVYFVAR
jgi:hypothetical protein